MEHSPEHSASALVRAGVIGAGQMGSGIAGALVQAGIATTLVDVSSPGLAAAAERIRRIAPPGLRDAPDLLTLATEPAGLEEADVVIEAVTEDEPTKAALFRSVSRIVRPEALLASNTSTIPIARLARAVELAARFAGMHFFHPVHRMRLVEVVRGEQTARETTNRLAALARSLGKTPIVVGDGPGFFTTRVLCPYLDQALRMAEEGIAIDAIDQAAVAFGMPSGPFAVLDLVGLDTALAIARVMAGAFPDRFRVSPLLEELVRSGRLGRKSGAGFRVYGARAEPWAQASAWSCSPTEITDRLFLPMLAEAIRTLEEGLIADPADADLGVVLGLGFPAARGGLMAWCDRETPAAVLARLARLEPLGPAFQPPALLVRMARLDQSFHPRGTTSCDHPA